MTFAEQLNAYIVKLGTTYTGLAREAGLSASALAHYVKGEREPDAESEPLRKIVRGLVSLSQNAGTPLEEGAVAASLKQTLSDGLQVPYDVYLANLNTLLKALEIRGGMLAKALSYDPSHISKILSGQRRPGDVRKFTDEVASFVARSYAGGADSRRLAGLLDCTEDTARSPALLRETTAKWLGSNALPTGDDSIGHFLGKLDGFDLDEFIQSIHFNDIKLPTAPFQLPTTKVYTGIGEMMESELDFIRATVLSRSKEDCILYSDMPLEEMASDPEFPKKWMFGRAMMLKKGLRLHIVHDVNRPFDEMMLGLEMHIPMYMTGQIAPYYLPAPQNGVFTHLLNVSGAAALVGHAMAGHQADGKYMLFKSKEDVAHYRKRAEQLLEKALPLMDIYRADRKRAFTAHLQKLWQKGDRRVVHSSLPLYTLPEDLLNGILARSGLPDADAEAIRTHRADALAAVEALLADCKLTLVLPELSREAFEAAPLHLALSELFIESDLPYRYEEYTAHLAHTKAFAASHPNLTLETDPFPTFRNITYTVIGREQVVVSKNQSPVIHFVIHHKKMVKAFQNFIPPIREDR